MYLDYWGLRERPFDNLLSDRFFYESSGHADGLARLTYAAAERQPIALLSGEYGTGKTMLCCALKTSLSTDRFKVIHLPNPLLSAVDLLGDILRQILETAEAPSAKGELLRALKEVFIRNIALGKHNVVIVDEAHLIEDALVFNELRMLLNYQYRDEPLLSLIFVGQTDLREKINRLPALRQRIGVQFHLKSLAEDDIENYVRHRLRVAGCPASRPIFASDSFPLIYRHSRGIPRIINNICRLAVLSGFQNRASSIGIEIWEEVFREVPGYEQTTAAF